MGRRLQEDCRVTAGVCGNHHLIRLIGWRWRARRLSQLNKLFEMVLMVKMRVLVSRWPMVNLMLLLHLQIMKFIWGMEGLLLSLLQMVRTHVHDRC